MVDIKFPLKIFDQNEGKEVRAFVDFHSQMKEDSCLDVIDDYRKTDREAREIIGKNGTDSQKCLFDKVERRFISVDKANRAADRCQSGDKSEGLAKIDVTSNSSPCHKKGEVGRWI
ncbi:MAG: hypothetical protein U1E11_09790 [Dethiobacteria bacterium]|nr:hypothetical protein [Dethiobacteria bacterium]